MRLNYAIIFVSDMKRSVAFYRDVLGISLKFESPEWTEFATEGATLALHSSDKPNPDTGNQQVAGRCRPGLSVSNLDEFHKRMLEKNVPCLQEPKLVFGAKIAQYADPDGLAISVSEAPRGGQGEWTKQPQTLSGSAQRVQDALRAFGLNCQVMELPASTRTAGDAAQAIGCRVEQIAKSLLFRGQNSGKPILAIVSGTNRVNETTLSTHAGEPIAIADADYARQHTGYAVGGVPPIGHVEGLRTFVDEDLLSHQEIWAAAGTPHAVFRLTPAELKNMTGGQVVSIK